MDVIWIDALSELWKNDDEIDFLQLERQHQLKTLERCGTELTSPRDGTTSRQSLLICLTGFGEQRDEIASKITSNGGRYTGDLTRRCTHLVVSKPEGKKFTAAKSWGVYAVTLDWLETSIERGMILEEAKFDPLLPAEERGVGAWIKKEPRRTSLGKRSRSSASNDNPERGARKLRKTASMKLNSQRNNLWGDILGRTESEVYSFANDQPALDQGPSGASPEPTIPQPQRPQQLQPAQDEGVFSNCVFAIHGFDQKRRTVLEDTVASLSGAVASNLRDAATRPDAGEPVHRFLVVPQSSQPDSHPDMGNFELHIVTEFYIEKCLHARRFFRPDEHVLGRPFPLFPIPEFSELIICSAAFTGLELNQVARAIAQLGAKFEEEFRRTTDILVCQSLKAMRRDKLKYALEWGVPVVSADWLWECISTGYKTPIDNYIFPELRSRYAALKPIHRRITAQATQIKKEEDETPVPSVTTRPIDPKHKIIGGFDASAFDDEPAEKLKVDHSRQRPSGRGAVRNESTTSADFLTARTHPVDTFAKDADAPPLTELSSARLNKSPPPPKHAPPPVRTRSEPHAHDVVGKPIIRSRSSSTPTSDDSNGRESSHSHSVGDKHDTRARQGGRQSTEQDARSADDTAAKKQAKAAERQALSSKLSSLIQSASGAGMTNIHEKESHTQAPAARPRRRQILGRAISNASNGSSAGASTSMENSGPTSRQITESLRAATAAVMSGAGAGADDEDDESLNREAQQPPATQLEYLDPQAQEIKAALMNKMMGSTEHHSKVNNVGATELDAGTVTTVNGRSLRKR